MAYKKLHKNIPLTELKFPTELLDKIKEELKLELENDVSKETATENLAKNINLKLHSSLQSGHEYLHILLAKRKGERRTILQDHIIDEEYVKPENGHYISGRTIRRILLGKNCGTRNIYAIAAYFEYPLNKADEIIETGQDEDDKDEDLLKGGWDFYYYHSGEKKQQIYRTGLWLKKNNIGNLEAELKFFSKKTVNRFYGHVFIKQGRLTIEFHKNQKKHKTRIYLCSKLPNKGTKNPDSNWVLNAGVINSGGDEPPVIGNVILVKNLEATEKEILGRKRESPEDSPSRLENEIITFLNNNQDRSIREFKDDTEEGLAEINAKVHSELTRENYRTLKSLLRKNKDPDYGWYSFSRIEDNPYDITVFQWNFKFNQESQSVEVDRERLNKNEDSLYKGFISINNLQIYARLTNQYLKSSLKSVVAIIESENDTVLKTISATTYPKANGESKIIAVREILCYLPKDFLNKENITNGLMLFYKFQDLDKEKFVGDNKLYLASRQLSTLSYPGEKNYFRHFGRIKQAKDLEGNYYILMRSNNDERPLALMTLSIDQSRNVTLKVKYKSIKTIYNYQGWVELYVENLHIHLEKNVKNSEKELKTIDMLFNPKNKDFSEATHDDKIPYCYAGVCIRTNHHDESGAYPFAMISKKHPIIRKYYPMVKPQTINRGIIDPNIYSWVLPEPYKDNNPEDYFFEIS